MRRAYGGNTSAGTSLGDARVSRMPISDLYRRRNMETQHKRIMPAKIHTSSGADVPESTSDATGGCASEGGGTAMCGKAVGKGVGAEEDVLRIPHSETQDWLQS